MIATLRMPALAENRRARFDYDILQTFEAGLELAGHEVKAVRDGGLRLTDAFVTFHNGAAFLTNAHIAPYRHGGPLPNYDPDRSRRLLLHRREIHYLRLKHEEEGLTIIPLKVYTKNRFIKVEVAVARGRRTYDKRAKLKERDMARETKRRLKEI